MTTPEGISVVEGVGNREQRNIQTHGESQKSGKGAAKGKHKLKKTHTATNRTKSISEGREKGRH